MKSAVVISLLMAIVFATSLAAQSAEVKGTWSGNWTKNGIPEAVTVEVQQDEKGVISGRFRTPVSMEFSKAAFNPKTSAVTLEAVDPKNNKPYRLEGKIKGNEISGVLTGDDTKGNVLLIKWTYFGR